MYLKQNIYKKTIRSSKFESLFSLVRKREVIIETESYCLTKTQPLLRTWYICLLSDELYIQFEDEEKASFLPEESELLNQEIDAFIK
jgi:hypothetical protein